MDNRQADLKKASRSIYALPVEARKAGQVDFREESRTNHVHPENAETRKAGQPNSTEATETNHVHTDNAEQRTLVRLTVGQHRRQITHTLWMRRQWKIGQAILHRSMTTKHVHPENVESREKEKWSGSLQRSFENNSRTF